MHSLMDAVLIRAADIDALGHDAESDQPGC
jgi:hypothetical protein